MKLIDLSFKSRITLFSLSTVVISMVVMLYLTHHYFQERIKNDLEGHLKAISEYIIHEKPDAVNSEKLKQELLSNKVLFFMSDDNVLESLNIEWSTQHRGVNPDNVFIETKISDKKWLMLYLPKELLDPSKKTIKALALILFLILLLSALIIVWRIHLFFEPMKCLIQLCNDVSNKSNSITVCNPQNKELFELKEAITSLMDMNRNLCENKVDIFKEVAHELKSPLAIMQARLTLLQDDTEYDLEKYIAETDVDITLVSSKLKELLFLKEIEWDMQQEYAEEVSMKEQCELMRHRFNRMLEVKQTHVKTNWEESFTIKAHVKVLQKVMQAIYENVFMHAKPQSTIYVKAFPEIKKIVIVNEIDKSEKKYLSSHIGFKIISRLSAKLGCEFFTDETDEYFITTIKFN